MLQAAQTHTLTWQTAWCYRLQPPLSSVVHIRHGCHYYLNIHPSRQPREQLPEGEGGCCIPMLCHVRIYITVSGFITQTLIATHILVVLQPTRTHWRLLGGWLLSANVVCPSLLTTRTLNLAISLPYSVSKGGYCHVICRYIICGTLM